MGQHLLPSAETARRRRGRGRPRRAGQRLAVLEAHLAGGPWLLGKEFTIADCNLAAVLYGSWLNGFDYAPYPKVKAWLDACLNRTAALKARKLREG